MSPMSNEHQQPTSTRSDDAQQAVIYTLPSQRYYVNYCCRQSMCVGTTLLITGLLSVVLQSVSIAAGLIYSTVCHGIWCGATFVIAGVTGLAAGVLKTQTTVVLFMVLSAMSAMMSLPLFTLSLLSAMVNGLAPNHHIRLPLEALSLCLMMMSLIAAAAAVWGSVISCIAMCCSRPAMIVDGSDVVSTFIITQQQQQQQQHQSHSYISLAQIERQVTADTSGLPPAYAQQGSNPQPLPQPTVAEDVNAT